MSFTVKQKVSYCQTSFNCTAVSDSGFLWGAQLLFGHFFPESCMKMKESGPTGEHGWYLLTVSRKRNRNEFAWKNTKKLTTHLIIALMCFLFFQANLILLPFPTHRQQVPSRIPDLPSPPPNPPVHCEFNSEELNDKT